MHKWLYRGSLAVIGIALAMAIGFWVTLFYPFDILKINTSPLPISPRTIKSGQQLVYMVNYCKLKPMKATVFRQLQNIVTIPLESYSSDFQVGCHEVTSLPVTIPNYVPTGEYKIRVNITYHPFPWREVEYQLETETFKVVK